MLLIKQQSKMSDNVEILFYWFKCLLFGLNVSSFLLAATIKEYIQKVKDEYPHVFLIVAFTLMI